MTMQPHCCHFPIHSGCADWRRLFSEVKVRVCQVTEGFITSLNGHLTLRRGFWLCKLSISQSNPSVLGVRVLGKECTCLTDRLANLFESFVLILLKRFAKSQEMNNVCAQVGHLSRKVIKGQFVPFRKMKWCSL